MKRIVISCSAIALIATLAASAGSAAASNWTERQLPPMPGSASWGPPLSGVSCPTDSLCVAVGGLDTLAFSQTPTAGAAKWHVVNPPYPIGPGKTCVEGKPRCCEPGGRLNAVSCASRNLCVAVSYEGFVYVATDPTGGAAAWRDAGTPGGPGDLEGVACVSTLLCAAGNLTGNVLTSTDPTGGTASWSEAKAGGSVQITGISCPTADRCVAVDNNGDVLTSTDPAGGAGWTFENLVPFRPTEAEGQPPRNALFSASCASISLCALVGIDGRIFTATDPFSAPDPPSGNRGSKVPLRPRTILVFAEHFWRNSVTRHRRIRARFRFYSPTKARGFECKRNRGPYRRCHSPLRYWATHGRHVLRVRAIGPSGLRGPASIKRFRVSRPIQPPHSPPIATASGSAWSLRWIGASQPTSRADPRRLRAEPRRDWARR